MDANLVIGFLSLGLMLGLLTLITGLVAQRWVQIVEALRVGAVIADRRSVPLHYAA